MTIEPNRNPIPPVVPDWDLSPYMYADEATRVNTLLVDLAWGDDRAARVGAAARDLVARVRAAKRRAGELESFMQEYRLTTDEGLALMGLAEALLRVPDAKTANALIRDKVTAADWMPDGKVSDWLVRAAGMGMSVTKTTLESVVARLGEPVIRTAMGRAIRIMAHQFVLGRTIDEGMKNARAFEAKGYRMSYDMLGEGARTAEDAERYFESYVNALHGVAAHGAPVKGMMPGISVKLSALHPRYRYAQADRCVPALRDKLGELARIAAGHNIALTVDAEEVERLDLSLSILSAVASDPALKQWDGLGLAVQAYSKRTYPLVDRLIDLARSEQRRLCVRLVKGAYWDTEIKRAQIMGLPDYPVFTRKANTDLSYLACAKKLMGARDVIYPMLATHNAHTVAAVLDMANGTNDFEFQRLHGMGESLYDQVILDHPETRVSMYAPVGTHEDLLPYLVRRLLENGANSSFVNKLLDADVPVDDVVHDPVADVQRSETRRHPHIAKPIDLYGAGRENSTGMDLTSVDMVAPLASAMQAVIDEREWLAAPVLGGVVVADGPMMPITNPANRDQRVGHVVYATGDHVKRAFEFARVGFDTWSKTKTEERAACLNRLADLMHDYTIPLMGLCVREAGKTMDDAQAELREAIDFCRYYAMRGRVDFADAGVALPGPTGESNVLNLHGRGVFVCISPWNFPLAIFIGQVSAALMAGNAVIAKPAEQTPLIAALVTELIHKAGVPGHAFALLPGDGDVGAALVAHPDVAGVAFTGSTEVARIINRALAAKDGPIVPLIAETGGQNAMIVDSSALPEQVVDDVIVSAFGSAGQRCSALRVLCLQDDVADKIIAMLRGAMAELVVGDPMDIRTDIGPVIDDEARQKLVHHRAAVEGFGKIVASVPLPMGAEKYGTFFAPMACEIDTLADLKSEVFGPILHIMRYRAADRDALLHAINQTGYGLTFGVHSRIQSTIRHLTAGARAGNIYINRTMIGAVVGVQPFGGQGLSGTGPKAGGPHYLPRFATEKTVTNNIAASGGNAALVSLND